MDLVAVTTYPTTQKSACHGVFAACKKWSLGIDDITFPSLAIIDTIHGGGVGYGCDCECPEHF